jgi:hypothetical protein
MRAAVFAHLNHLPLFVVNYHQIKIGPWLRNDRSRRNYNGFFTFQKNVFAEILDKLSLKLIKKERRIEEPEVKKITADNNRTAFLFFKMPHYTGYFKGLDDHRSLVRQLLNEMVTPIIHQEVNAHRPPVVGVHIRMGDFIKPVDDTELGRRGNLRTPLHYFITVIQSIRKLNGSLLPVTVFSDGSEKELSDLLKLPNVNLSAGKNDLADMLLLSRSQLIITSASSTFSYWASFLSDATVVMHPTYTGIKIRPENMRNSLYEGAFDEKNEQIIKAIHEMGFNDSNGKLV